MNYIACMHARIMQTTRSVFSLVVYFVRFSPLFPDTATLRKLVAYQSRIRDSQNHSVPSDRLIQVFKLHGTPVAQTKK